MRRGESKLWTGPRKKLGTFLLEKSNKTYCCRACLPTDGKMTNLFKGKANIIDGFFFFSPQVWEQTLNKIKGNQNERGCEIPQILVLVVWMA